MEIARIEVSGAMARVRYRNLIPAGLVGGTVAVDYSEDIWKGLTKTVVFRGSETRDVVTDEAAVTIPHETVAEPGRRLYVGFYGTDKYGTLVIPTIWADLGMIRDATDPSGDVSTDPSMPVYAQLAQQIEDLRDKVETMTPGSPGGGTGSGQDGFSPIASVAQTADGAVITITDKTGTTTATVQNGRDGDDGDDGGHYTPTVTQSNANTMQISFTPSKPDMPEVKPVQITLPVNPDYGGNVELTDEQMTTIINGVVAKIPVVGVVDADNNITIYGELKSGEYFLRYENDDGSTTDIGSFTVVNTEPDEPDVPVEPDEPDVPVEPDEPDVPVEPDGINMIPISTDTDGSIYNGTGYAVGKRFNSSNQIANIAGAETATNLAFVTGFIPVQKGDIVRLKNCIIPTEENYDFSDMYGVSASAAGSCVYDSSKTVLSRVPWSDFTTSGVFSGVPDSDGSLTEFTVTSDIAYMRLCLAPTGDAADAILTVNADIPDEPDEPVIPDLPEGINMIPISTDIDGNIYNGTGYAVGKRLNSSHEIVDVNNPNATNVVFTTGFIPVKCGDVVSLKNCHILAATENDVNIYGSGTNSLTINFYDSQKAALGRIPWNSSNNNEWIGCPVIDSDNHLTRFDVAKDAAYMRLTLAPNGNAADAIVTVTKPIFTAGNSLAPTFPSWTLNTTDTVSYELNDTSFSATWTARTSGDAGKLTTTVTGVESGRAIAVDFSLESSTGNTNGIGFIFGSSSTAASDYASYANTRFRFVPTSDELYIGFRISSTNYTGGYPVTINVSNFRVYYLDETEVV